MPASTSARRGEARANNDVFDGSDTSFRWLAGYSFSQYFAAEAGFIDAARKRTPLARSM
jgi:hypothetical protein